MRMTVHNTGNGDTTSTTNNNITRNIAMVGLGYANTNCKYTEVNIVLSQHQLW